MNSNETGNAATASQPGTGSDTESLLTWSPEEEAVLTQSRTPAGPAVIATESITPDRSGQDLTEEERTFLARVRRTREQGYMLSIEECDILLRILGRLTGEAS